MEHLFKPFTFVLACLLALLLVSAVSAAPFYVQVGGGVNFGSTGNTNLNGFSLPNPTFDPGGLVGGRVGFDFSDPSLNFPKWTHFFEVAVGYDFYWINMSNVNRFGGFFSSGSGNANALHFIGIAKYPLKVGNFILAPYIAVGPAVAWVTLGNRNSTNVALVVEPGARFMLNKNWFLNAAYRFIYTAPNFNGVSTQYYNSAVVMSVGYHF
jgi:opacity protein-like surface antigen